MTLEQFMEALQDLGDRVDSGCDDGHCHRYASRWEIVDGEWSIQIAPRYPSAVVSVDVRGREVHAVRLDGRLTAHEALPLDQLLVCIKVHVWNRPGRPDGVGR